MCCRISNLEGSSPVLDIPVSGKALMPLCHFELERSDYLDKHLPSTGPANMDHSNTRVIQFSVHGVGVVTTKYESILIRSNSVMLKCSDKLGQK